MPDVDVFFSNAGSRNDVRMRVVNEFSREEPGRGTGELATIYNYYVETLISENHIILTRPAWLHNGFDFLIRVENVNFNTIGNNRDNPSHEDIKKDLTQKREENNNLYTQLYHYIVNTYNCEEIQNVWFENLTFRAGYPCELLVKCIKWFFIEQDIRYWNYSGRRKFMGYIPVP